MSHWHTYTIPDLAKELQTDPKQGLSLKDIPGRISQYGYNQLPEGKTTSLLSIFFSQFKSPLIAILGLASVILFVLHEYIDASIILFVLIFNSVLGTIHEGRAQRTLAALKNFLKGEAVVIRDGEEMIVADREVVPGDLLIVREGDKICADARIIVSNGLRLDESSVTGESLPVDKDAKALSEKRLPLPDCINMLYKGTNVVAGNGMAIIVATGIATEIGSISQKIEGMDTEMPLKRQITGLSRVIVFITIGICGLLFFVGVLSGKDVITMFETVVSLSVSIVPEGLPVILTLVLATGVWRMSKRNALVKKLQAVEALGHAKILAVDKTGTITKNELCVKKFITPKGLYDVEGIGYSPEGGILKDGKKISIADHEDASKLIQIATLLANADLFEIDDSNQWTVRGEPTEAAMLVLARKAGYRREELERIHSRTAEIPFHYQRKYHAILTNDGREERIAIAGAPEVLFEKTKFLSESKKQELINYVEEYSNKGYRVICIATKKPVTGSVFDPDVIHGLTFLGLLCLQDVIRPEVASAVRQAQEAGIRIVMMTGDHKLTAMAIARDAGIYHEGDHVLTGEDLETMSKEELSTALATASVFARVTPDHKMTIVQGYQQRGEVIAMTGDGVNDAPALVAADLGIAMGKTGTDVAKEAADIILLDDNIASIVAAVEEGRTIYKNIKKVLLYLFSTNLSEVLLILCTLFLGLPLPLFAAQIIWLNLVTDSFLDVAIAMEPKNKNVLSSSERITSSSLIDSLMIQRIIVMSVPMAFMALFLFALELQTNPIKATTFAMAVLAVSQWFNAFNCRTALQSVFFTNPLSNRPLLGALVIVIALQLAAVYSPFLNTILHTTPLALTDWALVFVCASPVVFIEEIRKALARLSIRLQLN